MKRSHGGKHGKTAGQEDSDDPRGERLQKVLAAAGIGSRRQCEEFITAGRVEVDRKVVTELGTRVDPVAQEIRVDGESLRKTQRLYFAVNKPVGVVTTNFDPDGRSRVIDLVPTEERVFAVGRLDRSSEGLILVTNDGEFANRLTHPRYGVEKTYLVRIAGSPETRELERLKKGVHLAEGFAKAQSITVKRQHGQSTDLIIVLNEGRNREIRRIFARVGHKVLAIKRLSVGNIKLGDLPLGASRRLLPTEVDGLLHLSKQKRRSEKKPSAAKAQAGEGSERKPNAKPAPPKASRDGYVQKQAMLAQPLSLDDLLRDDLDEGPLPSPRSVDVISDDSTDTPNIIGDVIDYEDDFSFSPKPQKTPSRAKPPRPPRTDAPRTGSPRPARSKGAGQRPRGGGGSGGGGRRPQEGERRGDQRGKYRGQRPTGEKREQMDSQPRESFGKKRGGKRVYSPLEGGRGRAGEKSGNSRFNPKYKKKDERPTGADNQRRGNRRNKVGKKFGKPGGQRKGRR
jgi:23S rRNA pseudouridine2605 synthase